MDASQDSAHLYSFEEERFGGVVGNIMPQVPLLDSSACRASATHCGSDDKFGPHV